MKTIPSIEESICTSALKNYADVDDRYYEHFYWCPALKRQADGDNLLNHIKSKQGLYWQSFVLLRNPSRIVSLAFLPITFCLWEWNHIPKTVSFWNNFDLKRLVQALSAKPISESFGDISHARDCRTLSPYHIVSSYDWLGRNRVCWRDKVLCPSNWSVIYDRETEFVSDSNDSSSVNGDQVVMVHSNRVCLVTLAPSHPVVKDKVTVQ